MPRTICACAIPVSAHVRPRIAGAQPDRPMEIGERILDVPAVEVRDARCRDDHQVVGIGLDRGLDDCHSPIVFLAPCGAAPCRNAPSPSHLLPHARVLGAPARRISVCRRVRSPASPSRLRWPSAQAAWARNEPLSGSSASASVKQRIGVRIFLGGFREDLGQRPADRCRRPRCFSAAPAASARSPPSGYAARPPSRRSR